MNWRWKYFWNSNYIDLSFGGSISSLIWSYSSCEHIVNISQFGYHIILRQQFNLNVKYQYTPVFSKQSLPFIVNTKIFWISFSIGWLAWRIIASFSSSSNIFLLWKLYHSSSNKSIYLEILTSKPSIVFIANVFVNRSSLFNLSNLLFPVSSIDTVDFNFSCLDFFLLGVFLSN